MKHARRLRATVVRAAKPYWTHAPTSGEGAARFGGRFNPVGVPALYASFSFNTCAREVRFSLNAEPYTFYFLDLDCADIVDLSDRTVRGDLKIDWDELECPNWESEMHQGNEPACQALARRLISKGFAGAVVPSFATGSTPEDLNLVLWKWDDLTESSVSSTHAVWVRNRDKLPKDTSSWR
ncbi:MAG: RES family NAD+ phosphorylase [Pseudomonadota bacterium]